MLSAGSLQRSNRCVPAWLSEHPPLSHVTRQPSPIQAHSGPRILPPVPSALHRSSPPAPRASRRVGEGIRIAIARIHDVRMISERIYPFDRTELALIGANARDIVRIPFGAGR